MKKKYRFTTKSQSKRGIFSCVLAVLAVGLLAVAFFAAYVFRGQAGKYVAILGAVSFLLTICGFYHGIRGKKEENSYQLFPNLGCFFNLIVLAAFAGIYVLGWY